MTKPIEVYKGYSLRLFPTEEQEKQLLWFCEGARRVWNWAVSINKRKIPKCLGYRSKKELSKIITKLKSINPITKRGKSFRFFWLNKIPRKLVDVILNDVDETYRRKFKKVCGWPKYKDKNCNKSFGLTHESVYQSKNGINLIHLPIIGDILYKGMHDNLIGIKLRNPRIRLIERGNKRKWILSYSIKYTVQHKPVLRKHSMGIDLNIKNLAVTSSGKQVRVYKNINKTKRVKRLEVGLKNLHRKLSRRKKGSKNYEKARKRLNGKYYKLSCIREDYTHKVTTKIVQSKPKCIVLENLNVAGMVKNKRFAKDVQKQKFFKFKRCIQYKSQNFLIPTILADRFFPSSKRCSKCGNKKHDLLLNERTYVCDKCGLVIDRDLNAAKNLEKLSA